MPPNFLPPELQIENDAINRRRQLANALLQQGLTQDNGQMVGNIFVRPSPLQGLAKLFSVYAGVKGGRDADEQSKGLVQRHNQMTQDWISSAPRPTMQTQELAGPTQGGGPLTGSQTVNPTQQDMMQWAMKGMNVNPQIAGSMVKQYMQGPNANIAHLDPGKYTEDSIAEYQRTGNPWVLRPRATPNAEMSTRLGYDKLKQAMYMWENLSPVEKEKYKAEAAKQGQDAFQLYYNTGTFVQPYQPGAAVTGPAPTPPAYGAPVPSAAPSPAPGARTEVRGIMGNERDDPSAAVRTERSREIIQGEIAQVAAIANNQQLPPAVRQMAQQQVASLQSELQRVPSAGPSPAPSPSPIPAPPAASNVPPKRLGELRAEAPAAEQHMKMTNNFVDNLLATIGKVEGSKSVDRVTGVYSLFPSVPGFGAANTQADIDALKSQASIQALQQMRNASKTGGAVGAVTEKEWPRLESAVVALSQAQSEGQFRQRLKDLREVATYIKQVAEDAYKKQYVDMVGGQVPASTGSPAPAAGGLTPAEQAELDALRKQFPRR